MNDFSIDSVIRRTYRLIRERPEMFTVDRLHVKIAGLYFTESERIVVSYRHDILSALFHEVLHHLYPDWSEQRVLSGERFIMDHISRRRAINVLKAFVSIL